MGPGKGPGRYGDCDVAKRRYYQIEKGAQSMKFSKRYAGEEAGEFLVVILKNETGPSGLFQKMENHGAMRPCIRCGYLDCVCTLAGPQELLKKEANQQGEEVF